jgi:hypothetical protein
MRRHPGLFLIIPFCLLFGCIERYYPDKDDLKPGTLVVVAYLHNLPGQQSIYISRSSTIIYPRYEPVPGCYVEILNTDGTTLELTETNPGQYTVNFDQDFVSTGDEYCLVFITPEGKRYESEFERVLPAPAIDSIYYNREDHLTEDPDTIREGIQFYMDFEIEKDSGRHLRWQVIETFEVHNPEYPVRIYDVDRVMKRLPDSSSWRTCWITLELKDFYTKDLGIVEGDIYKQLPLHYVTNQTWRLHYRYSLLVRQLALTPKAFLYWDELGKNIQSQGQLFDIQPALTPGNICNVNDEDEVVIGYFSISGASEKRIFVDSVPGLDIVKDPKFCLPGQFPSYMNKFPDRALPVYIATGEWKGYRKIGEIYKRCADCREYRGSTHIKPDFW